MTGADRKRDLFSGWIPYAALAVVAAGLLLPLLGRSGLWDPCESFAAEVAREAAREGAWLPLRFDGRAFPGLPPLFYWIEALAVMAGGTSEWMVRIPAVAMVVALLLACLGAARRLAGDRDGTIVALALATSSFVIVGGRHTSPDLAASLLVTAALLRVAAALADPGSATPRDRLAAHALAALILPAAGLLPLGAFAAALLSGVLLGVIPLASLRSLAPDRRAAIPWILPVAWLIAGTATSGATFWQGLLTMHPHAVANASAFLRPSGTSFVWQIAQVGHTAYPWFIALPAAVLWLVADPDPGDARPPAREAGRPAAALVVLLAYSVAIVLAAGLVPGYLPLDAATASLPLVAVSAWGLTRGMRVCGSPSWKILIPLGALLVALGAGSQGVDFFWNPRRLLEIGGYVVDRSHPDMGPAPKVAVSLLAILVGISTAPALFFRRWLVAIPAAILASALGLGVFEIAAVFEKAEPYMSVGPLARAYRGKDMDRDELVAVGLDPQVRGGHVFYFERRMRDLGAIRDVAGAMREAAGSKRLVIVSSRVRDMYNEVYVLSCGTRIAPLNAERRWYSISSYEGPPPMPGYEITHAEDGIGLRIANPLVRLFRKGTEKLVTLLGWSAFPAAPATASASPPTPSGQDVHVQRGGWVDLRLFWRAEKPLEGSWKVLLEAVPLQSGKAAPPQIKGHHLPACGRHPTYLWKAGEVVEDRHFLYFPFDAIPGAYRMRTGLFRESDRMTADAAAGSPASGSVNLGVVVVE